ncbi:outer membrane protein assembly factor BamA [Parachlamydia sp. AcF125]|uniref:outer membrane protein assembly factor BamA n=1 Tax=Parachlamydia sp. AcF125 TaxID=2795736 RepID=UPI001BC8FCFD|nr:outer membrane protein assembly factor BamA [Parachlamydia sp. AcF125]MBS4169191.1 Outer membrane protein assembly factor BamA [Parachlamydia sp. AcF125]
MKQFQYALFILAIFLLQGFRLSANTYQYEGQTIEKIQILNGNQKSAQPIDENAIKARLKTKENSLFTHSSFDQDLKLLATEFDHVEPIMEPSERKIRLTLKVWPKPRIRIIRWAGNERIKTEGLQKELKIKPLTVFDRLAFNKAFQALKAYYVKQGFFEAQLDYSVNWNEIANEVEIDINIQEGRAGKIKKICFRNFTTEEKAELLDQMVTKEYSFLTSWLTEEGTYREEAMQHDQYQILNYLHNKGYADASVDIKIEEASQKDRIFILITAHKGRCYHFGKVTFEGNTLFDEKQIENLLTFKEGMQYSPEGIVSSVKNIANYYGRRGYIEAYVDYEPRLDPENGSYSLHLKIHEGKQYFVGLIKVLGNCSTETSVILHETLLVPGQVFNAHKLHLTEERLKNIGYFKNVNVYAVKSQSCELGENYRDLHIEVEETSTGRFGLAVGYSTIESLFGNISITENNFSYKGLGTLLRTGYGGLRGGGELLNLNATIGSKSRSYSLSWAKPFFMDTPWTVGFDIERSNNRYLSSDYTIDASQFVLHAVYNVNDFLRAGVHYRLRDSRVHLDHPHEASPILRREAKNGGIISALGSSLIYDSSDSPTYPRKGFKSRVDVEVAGLGGRHHFGSLAYINSYYIPVEKSGVLKFRADFRFIQPFGHTSEETLPLDEKLYLGGNSTIRGYRSYRLGPQFEDGEPRGGLSLQLYSAEYAHAFNGRMEGFVFCDAGYLSGNTWDFGGLNTSVGLGTRLKVLANGPPLTIGMGFPLNAQNRSEVKRFFLTIGGQF